MHLDVTCQHTTLTPALRQAVEEKFQRLSSHINKPSHAHVVLVVDGPVHRAEATVSGVGKPVHAQAKHENMYAAVDKLVSLLDRRWRKVKTSRMRTKRGKVPGLGKEVLSGA